MATDTDRLTREKARIFDKISMKAATMLLLLAGGAGVGVFGVVKHFVDGAPGSSSSVNSIEQLAHDLRDFRIDTRTRLDSMEARLAGVREDMAAMRSSVEHLTRAVSRLEGK